MRHLVLVGLVGCYAPNPPAGAPCDPASTTPCPSDQICTAQAGGHFCLPPGTPPSEADAAGDSPSADPDGTPPDVTLVTHFEYPADIAECMDPAAADPMKCRTENRNTANDLFQMAVDLVDTSNNNPWVAYIRFPIDDRFAGRPIASIKLRVTVTDDELAPSTNTGEIFAVAPFSLADLSGTAPAQTGGRLAPSQGAVDKLDVVDFPLPVESVTAGAPAHFGIFPVVTAGVNYWNIDGPDPPVLIIDTE